ncbi:PEP-CTERM sorting domain-containing protein [Tunturibacter psychrotolerans]|uniref:PEP-CTERM sorting domain-containing protein n=1 Tax=Tunturiibacter psychrotolerans TaxID=3069686 RepID=A0AAU7ZQ44_9BACT
MRKALFALPLFASALILPRTANADTTDLFTITGDSNTYTFTLPQQFTFPVEYHLVTVPAPTTTGTINGVGGQTFNVHFYTGIGNTGDSLSFDQVGVLAGPTLISFVSSTGNTDTAAIDPGSYRLIDYAHSITGPDYYDLAITPETTPPTPPAVPEPSTLILLSTGALALLLATRITPPTS